MLIIPAIDLKDGRCVRLFKGDFHTTHEVAADPIAVACSFRDAGASLIHVVDLDGARDGRRRNANLVSAIVSQAAPTLVELGGGLRSMDDLAMANQLGVNRFIIGSAAVDHPEFVIQALALYGARIAVGIDAMDGLARTQGWTRTTSLSAVELARDMENLGVETVIFTDIETDGMLSGPNWELLHRLRDAISCGLIASGGVRSTEDVYALRDAGLDGVIIGKALYAGQIDLSSII